MSAELLRRAAAAVLGDTGIRIPDYRWPAVESELRRLGGPDPDQALRRVERDAALRADLLSALAIPETYLFRHPAHFMALADLARERRAQGRPCRVLSAGCSSGEEAWSAAAVLASVYGPAGHDFAVEGWDLEARRLAAAAEGRYRSWSVRGGLHGFERFFTNDGEEWRVDERLRPFVRFGIHNLMLPPPPGPSFDAILFRNVAIYWEPATAERVVRQLCTRLAPDGLFLPGPSDPVRFGGEQWTTEWTHDAARHRRRAAGIEPADAPPSPPIRASVPDRAPAPPPPPSAPRASASLGGSPSVGWLESAAAHADAGRYREALDVLCARPGPLPGPGRLLTGIVLLSLDRPEEAFAWIRQAVFLDPDAAAARHWLAVAHDRLGQSEEAARERRNARDLER